MSPSNMPPGFWFHPKDFEIIGYLVSEMNGDRVPGSDGLIFQANVFGEVPPWDLFSNTDDNADFENVRFFFTFLKKISKNGSNFKRNVGNIGTWKGENRGVPIMYPKTNHVIGVKKSYSFRLNREKQQDDDPRKQRRRGQDHGDCRWLMTEYSTHLSGKDKKSRSDYVICRIKKKKLRQDNLENINASDDVSHLENVGISTLSDDEFQQYMLSHFNLDNPKIISDSQIPLHVEDGHTAGLLLSPETESAELQPNPNNLITLYQPSQQYSMTANDYSYVQPGLENHSTCALQTSPRMFADVNGSTPQISADENGSTQVPQPVGCNDDFGFGEDTHLHQTAYEEDFQRNHYSPQLFDVENIEEFFQDNLITLYQPSQQYSMNADDYSSVQPGLENHSTCALQTSPQMFADVNGSTPQMSADDYSSVQPGLESHSTCALQTNPQMFADLNGSTPQMFVDENGSTQVPQPFGCNDDFIFGEDTHLHQTAFEEDFRMNHYSPQLFAVENIEEFFQNVNMDDLTFDKSWQDELISPDELDNLTSAVTEDGHVDSGLW